MESSAQWWLKDGIAQQARLAGRAFGFLRAFFGFLRLSRVLKGFCKGLLFIRVLQGLKG